MFCEQCHDRGIPGVASAHVVNGKGMCNPCFTDGKPQNPIEAQRDHVKVISAEDGFEVVAVEAVPKSGGAILRAIRKLKSLDAGKAVRLPIDASRPGSKIASIAHEYADRYGVTIGTRVVDKKFVYIWKLDAQELAAKQAIKKAKEKH